MPAVRSYTVEVTTRVVVTNAVSALAAHQAAMGQTGPGVQAGMQPHVGPARIVHVETRED